MMPVTVAGTLKIKQLSSRAGVGPVTPPITPSWTLPPTGTPQQVCQVCSNPAGNLNSCSLSRCTKVGVTATCGGKTYCCGTDYIWGSQFGTCGTDIPMPRTPAPTALPDLVIPESLTFNPNPVKAGVPVLISFRIFNMGQAVASPAQYSYISQADGFSSLDSSNTCTGSTILKPGESCTSAYQFKFASPLGAKTLGIKLDPQIW